MAVNPQKLLPPARLSPAERMASAYDKKIDDLLNIKIKKKLINVEKVLNKTTEKKEKIRKNKKKNKENGARKKKEKRLEKGKEQAKTKLNIPGLPRTGFLDSIQNFVGYTFLGYLLSSQNDKLPALRGVVEVLPAAMETFGNIVTTTVDWTASFIEGSYNFRDYVSQKKGELDGPEAQKRFDEATDGLKNLVNSVLTLGLYQAPKKEKQQIPQKTNGGYVRKMAPGGNVTRSGRQVGGAVSRQIQRVETRRAPIVHRQQSDPGKDIGGLKEIQKIFPSKTNDTDPGPLDALLLTSDTLKGVPFVGPLMGAAVDIAMGQKPDRRVYESFGQSLAYMLKPSIDAQANISINDIVSTIAAMAEGGQVTRGMTKRRTSVEELGLSLGRLFQNSIETRLTKIFSEILRTTPVPSGGGAGGFALGEPEYVPPQKVYEYLKSKGLSHNHIMGMLANIQAESSFNAGAIGDGGTSGGLFQHHAERFSGMTSYAGKNWRKEWKKQIDYALREGAGRQYAGMTFETPEEASAWFTLNFEKPANASTKAVERLENLKNFGPEGRMSGAGPKSGIKITGRFGDLRLTGRHGGTDIAAPNGTPLTALTDGEVVDTGFEKGWGNFLVFRDDSGLYHLYGHMQHKGKVGKVKQGDIIGLVGSTGRSSGPHLHWEVGTSWDGYKLGNKFDPLNIPGFNKFTPFTTQPKADKSVIKSQKRASTNLEPPTAEVAATRPKVTDTAQQLAMTPSYAQDGGTTIILKEKILLKKSSESQSPSSNMTSIEFPGLNSSIPTLIG